MAPLEGLTVQGDLDAEILSAAPIFNCFIKLKTKFLERKSAYVRVSRVPRVVRVPQLDLHDPHQGGELVGERRPLEALPGQPVVGPALPPVPLSSRHVRGDVTAGVLCGTYRSNKNSLCSRTCGIDRIFKKYV